MDAAQLLFTLQADGFHVSLTGENIAISPVSKLSDALKADIRAHKLELVSLLAANDGKAGADCHHEWLVTHSTGERAIHYFAPAKSRAEVLGLYPAALVEPVAETEPEPPAVGLDARLEPTKANAVCCQCRHFSPNTINPKGGLGRCQAQAPASRRAGSLWPHSDAIVCRVFEVAV